MTTELNPTQISGADMLMLLNGNRQGNRVTQANLRKHKVTGGVRFVVGRNYNLIAYVAWLAEEKHRLAAIPDDYVDPYEKKKREAAEKSRRISAEGRDIGPIPAIKDPDRRASCEHNLELFGTTYMPMSVNIALSDEHKTAIEKMQGSVLYGAQFALAMPRGSGKTTWVIIGCIWAMLYGHRSFLALIGATEPSAVALLDSIKSELENNDLLMEDFPEVCKPIRSIEGNAQRCIGQTIEGQRTHMAWKTKEIKLPSVTGSKSSGTIIQVSGITGNIRGYLKKLPDGRNIRPDLVVVDDPQTDESAHSLSQNAVRLRILNGAILGLAGPGKKIAAFMPCTVIANGDMADTILNQDLNPDWQGQRTQMMKSFPINEQLWEDYEKIRTESLQIYGNIGQATAFYQENREAMDEGAEVSWKERFNPDEISGIQHAMNLKIKDETTFWSEYQNQPEEDEVGDIELISAEDLAKKTNGFKRYQIPPGVTTLTAGMDVQGRLLYYVVIGWDEDGGCYLIDYNAYPKQSVPHFTLQNAKVGFDGVTGDGFEADLTRALETVVPQIMDREYIDGNGMAMRVEQLLIDANWQKSLNAIYKYIRRSGYGSRVRPSHGRPYGATRQPMSKTKVRDGDKMGHHWMIVRPDNQQQIRYVAVDTNYWKSWINDRFSTAMGGSGCFTLFGTKAERHRMFAEQNTAEYVVRVTANERTVDEFKERPGKPDNHLFDGTVLCAVGANIRGIRLKGVDQASKKKRAKKHGRRPSEIIAEKRRKR